MADITEIRKPYAVWTVGDEEYRLKLTTADIVRLESRYKKNLMAVMGEDESGMPALAVMLDVTHAAMQKYQHGIKSEKLYEIFDKYLEEGGSQLEFYMSVYMEIFAVSGFFSKRLTDEMMDSMEGAKENL